jgi:hypothetical protein
MKLAIAALLTSAGCLAEPPEESSVGQGIINGVPIAPSLIRDRGLAGVPGCSAVLLSNNIVLTAGHCLSPGQTSPIYVEFDGQSILSDRWYRTGGSPEQASSGPDLAIIQVWTPFEVNGSTTGFGLPVEPASNEELVDTWLDLYGRGFDTTVPSGGGTWRTGRSKVVTDAYYTQYPDEIVNRTAGSGQTMAPGDSGGPSFIEDEAGARLVGIHSRGWSAGTCTEDDGCFGIDTLVYPHLGGLLLALDSPFDNGRPVEVFDVFDAEIVTARQPLLDINVAHWTFTAKLANRLSTNRGFVGGHVTGFQANGKTGLAPSTGVGYYGAIFFDARPDAIAASGEGFYDLNEIEWAHAQRVAMSVCRQYGAISGYFTGQQRRGHEYGLVCFKYYVTNMTATYAQLAATGWTVSGVVQTPYAQALRAAHEFCRTKGYLTGFLTGQQTRDRYGVTCQSN